MKIAILASGEGSTFENLVKTRHLYDGRIEVLFVSRRCGACNRARQHGITWIETENSEEIFSYCRIAEVDLICCAGWLKKLEVPEDFRGRVVNIHPSLLPDFGGKGMYGLHVHQAVLDAGMTTSGCTVHFVDDDYDTGEIILQRTVAIPSDATPELLQKLVQRVESEAYPEALGLLR